MITTIDHSVRETLGLTLVQYSVCDYCAKARPMLAPTGVKLVSDTLGLSSNQVSEATKELIAMQLLAKKENGFFYPTHAWYEAHMGHDVAVTTRAQEMTQNVIDLFNEINQTKYHIAPYVTRIKVLMKQRPNLTLEHFRSVFTHKRETWANDETMSIYNRPSTILSTKFEKYIDDANHYWLKKLKHASGTT